MREGEPRKMANSPAEPLNKPGKVEDAWALLSQKRLEAINGVTVRA